MQRTTTIDAEGNANGAYLRVSRKDDHGVWIAIGDNQREREVWFSDDQLEAILAALIAAVRQEHNKTAGIAAEGEWGDFFQSCDDCITKTHCAWWRQCLAKCTPVDLGLFVSVSDSQQRSEPLNGQERSAQDTLLQPANLVRQEHRTTTEEESIRAATTEQWGEFFKACDACITKTHCAQHGRCLAECVPADLLTV